LVLSADQAPSASIEPGCVLVPDRAGVFRVKARFKDAISNALSVAIDPPARDFIRLELEVDRQPMSVGERRPYKIWGYPAGRGPRQDLTHRVAAEASGALRIHFDPRMGDEVFRHTPPAVTAEAPGTIRMLAEYKLPEGETLNSEVVDIEVLAAQPDNARLVSQPSVTTVRVGERTPQIMVFAESPGNKRRRLNVKWSSEDESIAAPDPQMPGHFIGKRVGDTKLTATFGQRTTSVDVRVTGDPFKEVSIDKEPDFQAGNRFRVTIRIEAVTAPGEALEYRVSTVGDPDSGQWSPGVSGERQRFELSSPALKRGPDDTTYHLMLEARGTSKQVVARYPLSFSLNPTIHSHSAAEVQP
jgi:hypothetical protein